MAVNLRSSIVRNSWLCKGAVMSRIIDITRSSRSLQYLNRCRVISSTFPKTGDEGDLSAENESSKNENTQQKNFIYSGNVYLSKFDPLKGRSSKVTCGLLTRPVFNKSSHVGLLPTNSAIFWISKRWKECPPSDRPAPPPITCTKTPTNLVPSSSNLLDPNIPQPRVIIIGAGLAGISAAYKLSQSGFKNFQIVEAIDRPGGRIHSCWLGDVVGELGSLWISQACVANPLFALAVQENLLKEPLPWRRVPPADSIPFLSSDGRAISSSLTKPAVALFSQIRNQSYALFSMDVRKKQGSLLDFFKNRLSEEMSSIPDSWRPDISRVIWGLINELKSRFGVRPCQLSSEMIGSTISLPGGSVRVPLGLVGILGPLLKGIEQKCISYCRPVQGISWHGGNPRATVRFTGGDVLTADYIILTIPLGVLKCTWDSFFTPCIPQSKMNAIKKIGFGTLNRIILKYDKPFWRPGEGFFRLSWSEKELQNKNSWTKGISVFEGLPGTSNMLTITLGDEEAVITEGCSDTIIAEEITKTIRQFSGDPSLPYPSGIIRSKWNSEPFFRGATSFMSVDSNLHDLCDLASPLPGPDQPGAPIVLFAGEAAMPGYWGLLAAHLSGVREADRIIALTKKYSGPPPCQPS